MIWRIQPCQVKLVECRSRNHLTFCPTSAKLPNTPQKRVLSHRDEISLVPVPVPEIYKLQSDHWRVLREIYVVFEQLSLYLCPTSDQIRLATIGFTLKYVLFQWLGKFRVITTVRKNRVKFTST